MVTSSMVAHFAFYFLSVFIVILFGAESGDHGEVLLSKTGVSPKQLFYLPSKGSSFVCTLSVLYVVLVLSMYIPHLFFWCLGKAVIVAFL